MDRFFNSEDWFNNHWYQTLRHQPRGRLGGAVVFLVAPVAPSGAQQYFWATEHRRDEPTAASGQRLLIRM